MPDFSPSISRVTVFATVVAAACMAACSPSSLVDVQSPSTVVDPSQVQTAPGAAQLRANALNNMILALGTGSGTILYTATITDELQSPNYAVGGGDDRMTLATTIPGNSSGYSYDFLQLARVLDRQARQALQLYASNSAVVPRAWQGEMYALEGYTVISLAEMFCSGIPLSQSSLVGAQVPTKGLTTEELYRAAIALFDSAATAGADSASFVYLAHVGKARALLNLGEFAAADSAIGDVPLSFVYNVPSPLSGGSTFDIPGYYTPNGYARAQDREGGNGLVWSADPRTGVVTVPDQTGAMLWAAKYNVDSTTGVPDPMTPRYGISIRLADGLEAKLIHAEAALAAGDGDWLTTLNMLRASCVGTAACAPLPGLTSASLPTLSDPGTADSHARLDTLMKERAMWLYLTGHREGDLRRMAHVYGRDPETLWPTGIMSQPAYPPMFPTAGKEDGQPYGSDVLYGPDVNEHLRNPAYQGCYDTNP